MLNNIYNEGLKFPALNFRQKKPQLIFPIQYLSVFAFCSFIYCCVKALFFSNLFSSFTIILWVWVIFTTLTMLIVSKYTPGIQEIEILLEKGELLKTVWTWFKYRGKCTNDKHPSSNSNKQD